MHVYMQRMPPDGDDIDRGSCLLHQKLQVRCEIVCAPVYVCVDACVHALGWDLCMCIYTGGILATTDSCVDEVLRESDLILYIFQLLKICIRRMALATTDMCVDKTQKEFDLIIFSSSF
jgi:hypothetical protein